MMTSAEIRLEKQRLKHERKQEVLATLERFLSSPVVSTIAGCLTVEALQHISVNREFLRLEEDPAGGLKAIYRYDIHYEPDITRVYNPPLSQLLASGIEIGLIVRAAGGIASIIQAGQAVEQITGSSVSKAVAAARLFV